MLLQKPLPEAPLCSTILNLIITLLIFKDQGLAFLLILIIVSSVTLLGCYTILVIALELCYFLVRAGDKACNHHQEKPCLTKHLL